MNKRARLTKNIINKECILPDAAVKGALSQSDVLSMIDTPLALLWYD